MDTAMNEDNARHSEGETQIVELTAFSGIVGDSGPLRTNVLATQKLDLDVGISMDGA